MLRSLTVGLACGLVAACSPTFNWREVRVEGTTLQAMLPCKPDKGERILPLAGRDAKVQALGCDTGGATFVVLYADIGEPARAGTALDLWRQASLANIRAGESRSQPFIPAGALGLPQSVRVSAQGQRSDGTPVRSETAYFARGTVVVQAAVYASEPRPEWLEPFFQGLKFQ